MYKFRIFTNNHLENGRNYYTIEFNITNKNHSQIGLIDKQMYDAIEIVHRKIPDAIFDMESFCCYVSSGHHVGYGCVFNTILTEEEMDDDYFDLNGWE